MRLGLLDFDPTAATEIPGRAPRRRPWAPGGDVVARLGQLLEEDLQSARNGPKTPEALLAFEIMRGTGARIGEVCTLDWERDVDLEGCAITFRDTVTSQSGPLTMKGALKNDDPYRISLIPPSLARLLKEYEQPSGPVLQSRHGTQIPPGNIRRSWRRVQENTGIPKEQWLTPHDLRRSVGTIMTNELGIDAAAEQLGDTRSVVERSYAMPTYTGPKEARRLLG